MHLVTKCSGVFLVFISCSTSILNFTFKKYILAEVKKLISCSTELSMKLIMLINVKKPTIVGILKFLSMIDITSESLKEKVFFSAFKFYEQLNLHAQLG